MSLDDVDLQILFLDRLADARNRARLAQQQGDVEEVEL